MKLTASLDAPCSPEDMFAWVNDLAVYPQWLSIVRDTVPVDGGWRVELQGKVGPLARSKRLRMVSTTCIPNERVVFERSETDGRQHAAWTLASTITPTTTGCNLVTELGYSGAFWGAVVERLLHQEIEDAKTRLLSLVSDPR